MSKSTIVCLRCGQPSDEGCIDEESGGFLCIQCSLELESCGCSDEAEDN